MAAKWGIGIPLGWAACCAADEILFRYEGDQLPYAKGAGFEIFNACEGPCSEQVEDGVFVLNWSVPNDTVNYGHWIATPDTPPPPNSLWVEWRFRSNHPVGPNAFTCDGKMFVQYRGIFESINMYGDIHIDLSGNHFVVGLEVEEFHTGRFKSPDGRHYQFSVDGEIFYEGEEFNPLPNHAVIMGGNGACEDFNNTINEWDYVRYGTISNGERVISIFPPRGFVSSLSIDGPERFQVTFDQPGYVYIDEINIASTNGTPPNVTKVWRTGDANPETVEIVLDGPLPDDALTTFSWQSGNVTNEVRYTTIRGDENADGVVDLLDFPIFAVCEETNGLDDQPTPLPEFCRVFDFDGDDVISFTDFAAFQRAASANQPL